MNKEVFDAKKVGTAVAMERTGMLADKFNGDKGKAIDKGGVDTVTVRKETAKTSKRLKDIGDFAFYTLGPVYHATNVGFDIVGNYGNLVGFKGPRVIIKLDKPVISNIGQWGYLLEGLPVSLMGQLKTFMSTQTALVADKKVFWCFEHYDISCLDPLGVDRNDIQTENDKVNITLFLPSGNTHRYTTSKSAQYPIELVQALPRQHVIVQGNAAMTASKMDGRFLV